MIELVIETGIIRKPKDLLDKILHGSIFNDNYVFEGRAKTLSALHEIFLAGLHTPTEYEVVLRAKKND